VISPNCSRRRALNGASVFEIDDVIDGRRRFIDTW
jgi:hypothetical protein